MPDFSRDNKRSFTKVKNRSGPRTLPCGSPVVTDFEEEKVLLHFTYWFLKLVKGHDSRY